MSAYLNYQQIYMRWLAARFMDITLISWISLCSAFNWIRPERQHATHGDDRYCSQKCLKHPEISTTKGYIISTVYNCGIFTYETMVVLSMHIPSWSVNNCCCFINAEQHNVETMMYYNIILYCTFNIVILICHDSWWPTDCKTSPLLA